MSSATLAEPVIVRPSHPDVCHIVCWLDQASAMCGEHLGDEVGWCNDDDCPDECVVCTDLFDRRGIRPCVVCGTHCWADLPECP